MAYIEKYKKLVLFGDFYLFFMRHYSACAEVLRNALINTFSDSLKTEFAKKIKTTQPKVEVEALMRPEKSGHEILS